MRILHISKYSYPERGGIETFVRDLTAEQSRRGHSVCLLAHHAVPRCATKTIKKSNVTIRRCRTLGELAFAPLSPEFPLEIRRLIQEKQPQVIQLHMPNPAVLFNAILPAEIPLIVHWHADVQGSPNRLINTLYPAYSYFERQCLAKASDIIATTTQYLESSGSLAGWRDKCTVIPLGLDTDRYPQKNNIKRSSPPQIVSIGRFTFYKGYEYLVRAARLVPDAHFVIAGDGPELPKIQRLVNDLELSQRVKLPGRISDDDLHVMLQEATAFCLPSIDRGEAFGMVLLEAMCYELPLISTAIPGSGTGWVNQDGVTGHVVAPGSPEAIADAVIDILSRPSKATLFGSTARQRLEKHFMIEKVAASIDRLYNQLIV